MSEPKCIICGAPVGEGALRCVLHRGEEVRRRTLLETAERDASLLAMVDGERLSGQRIADRLGISRTQAYQKVKLARHRQKAREDLGITVEVPISG